MFNAVQEENPCIPAESSKHVRTLREQATVLSLLQHTHICKTYTHTYVLTYTHTYIHTYIDTHIHTYIRTYIHAYIRTYIHALHTYIHTYIHTYVPEPESKCH